MNYISLTNIRFHAFHGVLEQERLTGGEYTVSVRVGYDFTLATFTDNVGDTLNYAEVYEIVKREMMKPSRLIEHVAGRIARSIKSELPGVLSLSVTVTKLNPPMGGQTDGASVELNIE